MSVDHHSPYVQSYFTSDRPNANSKTMNHSKTRSCSYKKSLATREGSHSNTATTLSNVFQWCSERARPCSCCSRLKVFDYSLSVIRVRLARLGVYSLDSASSFASFNAALIERTFLADIATVVSLRLTWSFLRHALDLCTVQFQIDTCRASPECGSGLPRREKSQEVAF